MMMSQSSEENFGSQYALQIALQTMKERCQQFQKRLAIAEKENASLRIRREKESSVATSSTDIKDQNDEIQILTDKVEQLTRVKTQLTHHIFMVATENRHLWNRLSRLTKTNKSLGSHLNKITDVLQQHPPTQPLEALSYSFKNDYNFSKNDSDQLLSATDPEHSGSSLEEISLKLINNIRLEKSELEQQYAEMVEMQNTSDINFQNIGYSYPEYMDLDSVEQLKQHDTRLSHTKDILLSQQGKLKTIIANLQVIKKGAMCKSCREKSRRKVCQTGTQFNSDDSLKENGATQTSLIPNFNPVSENRNYNTTDSCSEVENKICPMCEMVYGKSTSCAEFHEHVLSHFTEEQQQQQQPGCDFEII